MKNINAFWAAFLSGIAAPGMLLSADTPRISRIETTHISLRDTMRGDWIKIGNDFGNVIKNEEARYSSGTKTGSSNPTLARAATLP